MKLLGDWIISHFLAASYISMAIKLHRPGSGTIYMNQSMRFLGPVRIRKAS